MACTSSITDIFTSFADRWPASRLLDGTAASDDAAVKRRSLSMLERFVNIVAL
jgi:hypothetical protein